MRIANWLRKRLNRPVKFNFDSSVEQARDDAHHELNRLADSSVVTKIERWERVFDPRTDRLSC